MIVVGYAANEYLKTKLLILYAKSRNMRAAHAMLDRLGSEHDDIGLSGNGGWGREIGVLLVDEGEWIAGA